jgi:hypothetical protein
MSGSESKKTVQIHFFSMNIERKKQSADDTPYNIGAIIGAFTNMLSAVTAKELLDKKLDLSSKKKVVWLDSYDELGDGCFNIIFKSAKYLQSRVVRNTNTMESRGVLKNPEDGDEEKTHLCVRRIKNSDRIIVALEFNYYGVGTYDIAEYINEQLDALHIASSDPYSYKISFEILPSADFLTELSKMKKINLLRVTMDIKDITTGDFQGFADRDELRPTAELYIRKKRGKGNNISSDLIRSVYQVTGGTKQVKRIAVEGANESGNLKIDSESIQMKHSVVVDAHQTTNEVNTADFFEKVSDFIKEMGV